MRRETPIRHRAVLIGDSVYRLHTYGKNHPLGIPRVSLAMDVIESYGALQDDEYLASRKASPEELEWFHTKDYVSAVKKCEELGKIPKGYRARYNLGGFENPWFEGIFSTPGLACGASIQGAEQVLSGTMAFNPAGGMHHAMPDKARGFCFFNDVVLGILRLRKEGLKVLYLDMDAHHCDGVEYAFRRDPMVVTVSVHMDTNFAYPFRGGSIEDVGPVANAVNLPLPKGVNDSEYRAVFSALWPAVLAAVRPDVVVLQSGTDVLFSDPLGKFELSTQLVNEMQSLVVELSPRKPDGTPRLLVVGGGGYHPLALARCWAGLWGVMTGRSLPEKLPDEAVQVLRDVAWDDDEDEPYYASFFEQRIDEPREGPVRQDVLDRMSTLFRTHPLLKVM
ncbi:MAG: acetoin utilization protein AcuC [Desulfatiglandaceae bacterium]